MALTANTHGTAFDVTLMTPVDASNDIPMISWAGLGVAMGNATDEVKKIADVVALSNNEDGAAKAILQYAFREETI